MITRCPSCFQEYDTEYGMCPHCGFSVEGGQTESCCLLMGTEINDRYVIGGMLGLGGFGITYRAWDKKLETVVAVKEYFPTGMVNRMPGDTEVMLVASKRQREVQYGKERFLDEARNLAYFNTHPNIVNVSDYFEANHTAYIVMEYLDGKTLGKTVRDQGRPLPPEQCCDIAHGVCEALRALHAKNVLHRDVSPDNIFICKNGTVKLIDFGAARFAESKDTRLTIVVKPGFAPPEQYDRINRQGPWTDIYALGGTLYYALTGHRPLESTNRKIQDELLEPSAVNPNIPENISTVVTRAMAIDPQYRYQSVDEFEKALLREKTPISVGKAKKRKKTKRLMGIGAAVTVVIALFAAAGLIWQNRQIPTANLNLWYMLSGNPDLDSGKETALQTIAGRLEKEYKTITVSLKGVDSAHYQETLERAESNEKPDIYESTGLVLSDTIDLRNALDRLRADGGFMDAGSRDGLQYPTGLIVPVIYVNTSLIADGLENFQTYEAIKSACAAAGGSLAVSQGAAELYKSLYGAEVMSDAAPSAQEDFLQGKTAALLGSSMDYQRIQDELPGLYSIHFPNSGYAAYGYDSVWSVKNADLKTERAAILALEYLANDAAQDYLHIRQQNGAVPITREMLSEYEAVYPEMSELSDFLALPFAE